MQLIKMALADIPCSVPTAFKQKKTALKSVHPLGNYGATDRHTDKQSYNTRLLQSGVKKRPKIEDFVYLQLYF